MAGPFGVNTEVGNLGASSPNLEPTVVQVDPAAYQAQVVAAQQNAQVFQSIGQAASGVIGAVQKSNYQQDLDALRLGAKGLIDPDVQNYLFSDAAQKDPSVQRAQQEFSRLQLAAQQGRMPSTEVQVRAESLLKQYINQTPGFAPELRGIAKQTIGFDPSGAEVRSIMSQIEAAESSQRAALEPRQKAQNAYAQSVETLKLQLGVDDQTAQAVIAKQQLLNLSQTEIELKKNVGAAQVDDYKKQVQNIESSYRLDLGGKLLTQIRAGGVVNPEEAAASIRVQREQIKRQIISGIPSTVPADDRQKIISDWDNETKALTDQVADGSMLKLMQTKNKTILEMESNNQFQDPILRKAYAIGGPTMATATIEAYAKIPDSATYFDNLKTTSPSVYYLLQSNGITNKEQFTEAYVRAGNFVFKGEKATTTVDQSMAGRVATDVIISPESAPQDKVVALDGLLRNMGEVKSLAAINSPESARAIAQNDSLKTKVGNLVKSNIEAGTLNSAQLLATDPMLAKAELQFNEQTGRIEVKQQDVTAIAKALPGGLGAAVTTDYRAKEAELQKSLDRLNQVMGLQRNYSYIFGMPEPKTMAEQFIQDIDKQRSNFAPKENQPSQRAPGQRSSAEQPSSSATAPELSVGSVSAQYESGGAGAGTVSSGRGDPGGKSYGTHQLASKTGTLGAYLDESQYGAEFEGLKPGSRAFDAKWKEVAARDPQGFAEDQKRFIIKNNYEPLRNFGDDLGLPRTKAIDEALFSMGVQHGGAKAILRKADRVIDFETASEAEIVKALYDARRDYVAGVRLPAGTRKSVLNRYAQEERDITNLVGQTQLARK